MPPIRAQEPPPPTYQSTPWISTGGPIGGLGYDIRMHPENSDIMYVTGDGAGIFKSVDGGATWGPSSAGMPPEASVRDFAVDAAHPGMVYAATLDSGVFVSLDGGETWRVLNDGLTNRSARDLALTADGSDLYLATNDGFRLGAPAGVDTGQPPEAGHPTPGSATPPPSESGVSSPERGLPCLGGALPLFLLGFVRLRSRSLKCPSSTAST